jgi:uncharacterized damage-inducible protein DinB
VDTLDRLLEHDRWATQRVLDACRGLSAEQLHQRFEMGPGSVHDTLAHIIAVMERWADRIDGRDLRPPVDAPGGRHTTAELESRLDLAAADLRTVAERVRREVRLDEVMEIAIRGWPAPFRFTRGTALVHVCTHGVHHRAQVLNMLRRLEASPLPEIDAIEWELTRQPCPGPDA